MKELSIEEKAKAYDETLTKGLRLWESGIITRENYEYLFPELKESEDEKIRGAIIDHLKDNNLTEWAAWLEKQREQKPADKIEPKFKAGDWIISDEAHEDYRICKIIDVGDGNYKIESIHGYKGYNEYKVFDSIYRLWTIKDAKPGDVLAYDNGNICIFDGTVEEGIYPFAHCGITRYGFEPCDRRVPFSHDNNIHPATKNQREFLFAKMKEVDYEWDAEKNVLKAIDKKHTDLPKGEDYGIDGLGNALRILEKTLGEVDGYQTDDGILEHKCAINAVKELYEKNTITDEELARARKEAYNEALDKNEYDDEDPTFADGWDAAIWYLKKKNVKI